MLSLVLAIGANTAIFSLLNAVLLRPLPYPEPERLVTVWEDNSKYGFPRNLTSPPTYRDCATQNNAFEQVAATRGLTFNLTGGDGDPEEASVVGASANLFTTLGVRPIVGRDFQQEEDQPGANRVAILSYPVWAGRYGSDPGLINQNIYLDNQPYTVVGVMPRGIDYPDKGTQIWIPIAFTPEDFARRSSHFVRIIGRLKPGATFAQAKEDMRLFGEHLIEQFPDQNIGGIVVFGLKEMLLGDVSTTLLLLTAAIGCVLLITCSNTANLMLVRAARRKREIAVRIAIGANRSRLFRQWLTESMVLAVTSAVIGLILAPFTFSLLKVFVPEGLTTAELRLDPIVLAFTLFITLLTALLFGTIPAFQSSRLDPINGLKHEDERGTVGGKSRRLQKLLVVAEVSLALLPLIGAGLLIQTYARLRNVKLGFEAGNTLTMRTPVSSTRYETPEQRLNFFKEVLNRVRALPGVESAGYINSLPLTNRGGGRGFLIEGRPAPGREETPLALYRPVSAGYFETIRMPLISGRYFDETDGPSSKVVIINQTMATKHWPDQDPVGQRVKFAGSNQPPAMTIVGVVGDVKETGIEASVRPVMYVSYLQFTQSNLAPADLAIRTTGDPLRMGSAVRQQIWSVDPNQPISRLRSLEEIVDTEVSDRKANMLLLTLFAGIALIQAVLGVYGVLASLVIQRTKEMGLRMALGATPTAILRTIAFDGMVSVLIGLAIGVGSAVALGRFVSSLLFGITPTDPITLIVASAGVLVAGAVAILVPARRAMKIDPMTSLRLE
jgi:putative ABC transport system permease protein